MKKLHSSIVSSPIKRFTITTLPGLEEALAEELQILGLKKIEQSYCALHCEGNEDSLYRMNLALRTGLRVLWEIHQTEAQSVQELYQATQSIPWNAVIHPHHTFAVSATCSSVAWASPRYIPLVVKDAVADQFSSLYGKRPSVDTRNPHLRIHLHVTNRAATFSIDSSGESLHRRGYRLEKTEAPLSEVLAAGILKLIHFHPGTPLYDPMCGSGTFLVEAGMIAQGIYPGILRKEFGFEGLKIFNKPLYEKIRSELWKPAEPSRERREPICIYGSDKDPTAVQITERNLARAGIRGKIFTAAFEESAPPYPLEKGGVLVMNPPYGKRLEDPSIIELYRTIGDTLKKNYPGVQAWILSGNPEGAKQIGLRSFRKIPLKNGPIECKLLGFNVVPGKYQR